MNSQIESLSPDIAGELAFPTMVTRLPMVRDQFVRTLAELQSLKAMLVCFVTPEMRRQDTDSDAELTQYLPANELDRLQMENAALME